MERYTEYKDSGVQWIGEIPSHWDTKRIASLFTGRAETNSDFKYRHAFKFYYGTLVPKNEIGDGEEYRDTYIKYSVIEKNDILINGLNLNYDFVSQRVAIAPSDGIITSAYIVVRPREGTNAQYYNYLFKTMDNMKMFHGMGTGIRLTLSFDELKKQIVLLPPLPEQEKIVSFLEEKTSKIDAYIVEKEKEIQLLEELKQKTIADAVTKGLNPDAKMKDSGISWIEDIPEHWETRRAKFMFKKNKRERRPEDEVITCFRDGQVTFRKNRRLTGFTESEKYDGYQGIRKGDLVIHQMDAFAGSIGVSDSDGMGTSVYHCCTPTGDYNVYYYAYLIRQMALSGFIQSLYKGIRERSSDFSFPVFGNQYLIIPPSNEQQAIVAYIEEKCEKIDKLASELQSEIDYLKEYKQRLIADCVTGQVNVQNV